MKQRMYTVLKRSKTSVIVFLGVITVITLFLTIAPIKSKGTNGMINHTKKELTENYDYYNSINNWILEKFGNSNNRNFPFTILSIRDEKECYFFDGKRKSHQIKNKKAAKFSYKFFARSNIMNIVVYRDVIVYKLEYSSYFFNQYSLIYYVNKNSQRLHNYRKFENEKVPANDDNWLYHIKGSWYLMSSSFPSL